LRSSGANVRHGQDIDLQRKVESDIADRWARGIVDGRPEPGLVRLAEPREIWLLFSGVTVSVRVPETP